MARAREAYLQGTYAHYPRHSRVGGNPMARARRLLIYRGARRFVISAHPIPLDSRLRGNDGVGRGMVGVGRGDGGEGRGKGALGFLDRVGGGC